MNFRHMSDGICLDKGHHGHGSPDPWSSGETAHHAPMWASNDSSPQSLIHTGDNSAGDGGDGSFFGALLNAPVAIYEPVNIAVAGPQSTADAHQSNLFQLDQDTVQIAGIGGNGGNGNAAVGGNVSLFDLAAPSSHGLFDSAAIDSGDNQAGNGGDGIFSGALVHASLAVFEPINIAVAGYNSIAHADQTNDVQINQAAVQMAGIGGNGGNGNAAAGGNVGLLSSTFGFGFDTISTGSNSAGNGGNGSFFGKLVDASVAVYAPINIAISGFNASTDASQTNTAHFDQSAIQIAGVGGNGGGGNLGLGGDIAVNLLSDLHLFG
jgi:hypothetical protein